MPDETPAEENVSEKIEAVADTLVDAAKQELKDEQAAENAAAQITESALDNAQEQVDAANEAAENIARAAIETELGRRVVAVDEKVEKCQTEISQQATTLTSIQGSLKEIQGAIAAAIAPKIQAPPQAEPPHLTPQNSELAEAVRETIAPENLSASEAVLPIPEPLPGETKLKRKKNLL